LHRAFFTTSEPRWNHIWTFLGGNMYKLPKTAYRVVNILVVLMMTVGSPLSATASTWTDPTDYPPGSTVTIQGDNSNFTTDLEGNYPLGEGYIAGEEVLVNVTQPVLADTLTCIALVTDTGYWSCEVTLNGDPVLAVGVYTYLAVGVDSGTTETGTFTDANPSANLDQCANDPYPSPSSDGCNSDPSQWVNGNLGQSKAVYYEGDSVAYRMRFDSLSLASHTVTIEWDTTKSSKHALDYLTTFNQTVLDADPCLGVIGCGSPTTYPIPDDPQVTGAGVTPIAGNFTLYGGTITDVSAYSYPDGTGFTGDMSARITITFDASVANPVLAWGGHISARNDWGMDSSAVAIPGSPYHMRLIDLDGKGGNQDRSLSADAVIYPGSITIIKDADPNGSTVFNFTASPLPLDNFTLVDDGVPDNYTKYFGDITVFQTYTVQETLPDYWVLQSLSCSVTSAYGGSQTTDPLTGTATINLKEGENVTCTFGNRQQAARLTLHKTVVNDNGGSATASSFQAKISGNNVPWDVAQTLLPGSYTASEVELAGYTASDWGGDCAADGSVTLSDGDNKTCSITNDDQQAYITVVKVVNNNYGGTALPDDFDLTLEGGAVSSGVAVAVDPGTYTAGETLLSGTPSTALAVTATAMVT
jgi:hypothetical protein